MCTVQGLDLTYGYVRMAGGNSTCSQTGKLPAAKKGECVLCARHDEAVMGLVLFRNSTECKSSKGAKQASLPLGED